jgi:hypothetical protein
MPAFALRFIDPEGEAALFCFIPEFGDEAVPLVHVCLRFNEVSIGYFCPNVKYNRTKISEFCKRMRGAGMTHDPRFSIIPGWIVTDSRLKGRDLQVLCLLGRHTDKQGWCRRSQVKMASQLNCARSTVQAALDRLSDVGVVEKHQEVSQDGRDSAHYYRVIYDRAPPAGYEFNAWQDGEEEENIPVDGGQGAGDAHTPADISAPPADPESAPPAGPGSAPIKDPCLTPPVEPKEREGAGARDVEEEPKKMLQRVKALELGRHGNPWPGALQSSTTWALGHFEKLSPEERRLAEDRRDDYLAICERQKAKPVAVGVYLRDRKFLDVPGQQAKAQRDAKVEVAPFGPLWAALRMQALLAGPERIDLPDDLRELVAATYEARKRGSIVGADRYLAERGIAVDAAGRLIFPDGYEAAEMRRKQLLTGFPEVNRLHEQAKLRERPRTDGKFAALADLCEAVPVDSPMFGRWLEYHETRNWPFVPAWGSMRVVFFPKGGPEAIERFRRDATAVMAEAKERIEGHVHAAAE